MYFPKIVAAQRLQTWLLVAALLSVVLIALLVVDLSRNLRTVVISETNKSLANASKELTQAGEAWISRHADRTLSDPAIDRELQRVSYDVLRSYPDVEGGFIHGEDVIGHSFPTYTEPNSNLRQPPAEYQEVLAALAMSRASGRTATRVLHDGKDLVMVAAATGTRGQMSAWCLRRIINFSDSSEWKNRLVLVTMMVVALACIGFVLKLSFNMQRGFAMIQGGLDHLKTDASYRLPDQNHELSSIVQAINAMAEGRQKLEADLRREDRLRVMGRVVAGIAHEIRNPLNSIRLTIRVLARRLEREPASREPITLVTSEIDRLDTLLRSLLVFRPDALDKVRQQPIQPIVERTLALVKPHAEEHGVVLRSTANDGSIALVNSDYLQQALMNLLLNAIDASSRGGVVDVSLHRNDGRLQVDIEDGGPGITPELQEHLFEAFYTTKSGGSGLGLAVTKTLLEKMDATIQCGPGERGARFSVILPTRQPA